MFKTKEDVESYLKWETFEGYTIEPVYDDDIEEPLIMTFEEYVIKWAISNMNANNFTPNNYEDILIWLRDNGIPKTIGCDIAKRILKYYEL